MSIVMRKILFTLLLPALLWSCIGDNEEVTETKNYVVVGDRVPDFEIENTLMVGWNGLKSPDDFTGKKTLLVFYVTTCGDCRRELPYIEHAFRELGAGGLTVIPISRGETYEKVQAYWTEAGFIMPRFFDPDRAVFNLFANQTVPRIYLVDEDAKVVWMCVEDLNRGAFTEEKGGQFNDFIREKLNL